MPKNFTIGIDFGTLSARAVALDLTTGEEVAEAVFAYPHGVMDRSLPTGEPLPAQFALQHPQDYLDALCQVIGRVCQAVGSENIAALCIDFTTCTVLPVDEEGSPLCFSPEFCREPHAYVKLWKHHGAVEQALVFDAVANRREEHWMVNCGGTSSSEWLFPKLLETLQAAPAVFEKTHRFLEAGDWLSWQLTGRETHNPCMAGLKAYWCEESGYPSDDFFREVDPRLVRIVGTKVCAKVDRLEELAGFISPEGAKLTGLPVGTPVAMPIGDAHASMPALNVTGDGEGLLVLGTSGVLMLNTPERPNVPGICSQVYGGVVADRYTIEAGQAGLGDCFDWFVKNCVPERYEVEARQRGISVHTLLQEKASALRPGESRLVALDWFNGNRSILKNDGLSGLILGLNLQTRPEEIYRALLEATAYGMRVILENYESHGVSVGRICAAGGIALKSPMLMQIYADVLGRKIDVGHSAQSGARGSALYAAVAAGACQDIREAARRYARPDKGSFTPIAENQKLYHQLYQEYRLLHDHFGRGGNAVMDRLYGICRQAKQL